MVDNMAKIISITVIILAICAFVILPFMFSGDAFGDELEPTFDQSKWEYELLSNEINCLALNLYFEARDQDKEGQIAVGLVTINRVLSKHYPNSICDVVWQQNKNKKGNLIAQFSWTLDGMHDSPLEIESCSYCRIINR